MSTVRIIINGLLSIRQKQNYNQQIKHLSLQAQQLKVPQLQQLMHQISQLIYQREETASIQLSVLQLVKMLLISGIFSIYALSHVYIFPWVLSIVDFHKGKDQNTRAKLFLRETTGKYNENETILDSFKQLLAFAQQFLIFFGSNLKFYPYSKYKIKNSLAQEYTASEYKSSLSRFTVQDLALLKSNLEVRGQSIREQYGIFADFLNAKLQECFENPSYMHDNVFLLKSLAEMGESYCINCITFQLKSYFLPQKALIACKIANFLVSTAQIETLEAVNIRCLPRLLESLFPIDFRDNRVLSRPKQSFVEQDLNMLIDYYYLWFQKTKLLKLSIKIYENSYHLVEYLKKPNKIGYQSEIQQFQNNIQKLYTNNQLKQTFIIDQHREEEQSIISLLKQLSFCLNSQRAQRQIAYQNVLDDLTITDEQSNGHISQFSKSMLKSQQERQQEQQINILKRGKSLKSSSGSSKKYSGTIQGKDSFEKKQNIENIYYDNSTVPDKAQQHRNKNSLSRKQLNSPVSKPKLFRNYEIQHYAEAIVSDPSLPKVTSNNSRGRHSAKSSSKSNEISIHSSQFSQKENNLQRRENRNIQSIYVNKSNMVENKDQSGQFLYFERQSLVNSEKEIKNGEDQNSLSGQIQFQDSLKQINNSQSSQILQFGMDPHARVPQTVGKPKFNFKAKQNEESSPIEKNIFKPRKEPLSNAKNKASQQYYVQKIIEPSQLNEKQSSGFPQTKFSKVKILESERQSQAKKTSKIDYFKDQESSIIKENSKAPHMISQSISFSTDKAPSNFSKVFREKEEKASVLSSSRSLRALRRIPEKKVEIPDFKKLRDLQNQLGQLKKQAKQVAAQLQQKNNQLKKIQAQKMVIHDQDPYYLKKQNEIMKILLKNKDKGQKQQKTQKKDAFQQLGKSLTKQLKQSSIKNYNMSLKDYKGDLLKIKFSNIKPYLPQMKKNIISNRCILAKDQMIEVGYSYKNGCATLYLTLNIYCQSLAIKLEDRSVSFTEDIERSFDKLLVGKQMKFKTFTIQTKQNSNFESPKVFIQLYYHHKNQQKKANYECQLPLTPYNMAKPISQSEGNSVESRLRSQMTPYITPLYTSCQDLFKKGKAHLLKVFPHGLFNEKGDVFSIYYEWKEKIQLINIKLKQKAFRIQGNGYPLETGRQLIEAIINILAA